MTEKFELSRWTRIKRALRLRCPQCGKGKLFHNWFFMPKKCPECGLILDREPGYYLGSIYVNYGLTAFAIAVANPLCFFKYGIDPNLLMYCSLAFVVVFPILFFPFARALWLAFDLSWDPPDLDSYDNETNAEE